MYVLVKKEEIHFIEGFPQQISIHLYHSRFRFITRIKMNSDYTKLIKYLDKRSNWTPKGKTLRASRIDKDGATIFYFDNEAKQDNPYYHITSTTFHIYKSRELCLKDDDRVIVK